MKEHVDQVIRRELDAGETLLWWGSPKPGILFKSTDIFITLFGVVWMSIVGFVLLSFLHSDVLFPVLLVPLVMFLIGFYIFVGRYFFEAKERESLCYGLTNKRVLIVSRLIRKAVKSLSLKTLTDMTLKENRDGTGTIIFCPAQFVAFALRLRVSWPGATNQFSPSFDRISQARSVYDKIRSAQASLK